MGIISSIVSGVTRRVNKGPTDQEGHEMGFLDHIDDLRKHIVRAVIAVIIGAIFCFMELDIIMDEIILAPINVGFWTYRQICSLSYMLYNNDSLCIKEFKLNMQNLSPGGQFSNSLYIALIGGLIIAFPYIVRQVWLFIKPALKEKEQKNARSFTFFISLLFLMGIVFGFFILTPMSLSFLANYELSSKIENNWTLDEYLSFVTMMVLACGLIFELPIVIYFLTKIGLLGSKFMQKNRRYAVVIILIISAILTPSPDMSSQLLMATPLYLLFEFSIYVSRRVEKGKEREQV